MSKAIINAYIHSCEKKISDFEKKLLTHISTFEILFADLKNVILVETDLDRKLLESAYV